MEEDTGVMRAEAKEIGTGIATSGRVASPGLDGSSTIRTTRRSLGSSWSGEGTAIVIIAMAEHLYHGAQPHGRKTKSYARHEDQTGAGEGDLVLPDAAPKTVDSGYDDVFYMPNYYELPAAAYLAS